MADKKVKQISILGDFAIDGAFVKPEELLLVVDALLETVKRFEGKFTQLIEKNNRTISQSEDKALSEVNTVRLEIIAARKELESHIDAVRKVIAQDVTDREQRLAALIQSLSDQIQKVSGLIPSKYDDKSVWERIGELATEISTLPQEQTGEDYRNALEALQDDDRLDVSAIRGLEPALKKMKVLFAGGAGAQGGITAVHAPLHETFTMNGSDAYVTLSQGVGAAGRAIFACRLNNGMLDMDKDYAVNGNRITFNFTPQSTDIISVTYLS